MFSDSYGSSLPAKVPFGWLGFDLTGLKVVICLLFPLALARGYGGG
ncbi:hypothetical protein LINPERHAP1_LOCUS35102 [Linum perenne]